MFPWWGWWYPPWKKGPWLVGIYRGWKTTQLYGDYFINHEIRIPSLNNQDSMESTALKLTASLHLNHWGWKMSFLLGWKAYFQVLLLLVFREGKSLRFGQLWIRYPFGHDKSRLIKNSQEFQIDQQTCQKMFQSSCPCTFEMTPTRGSYCWKLRKSHHLSPLRLVDVWYHDPICQAIQTSPPDYADFSWYSMEFNCGYILTCPILLMAEILHDLGCMKP